MTHALILVKDRSSGVFKHSLEPAFTPEDDEVIEVLEELAEGMEKPVWEIHDLHWIPHGNFSQAIERLKREFQEAYRDNFTVAWNFDNYHRDFETITEALEFTHYLQLVAEDESPAIYDNNTRRVYRNGRWESGSVWTEA